MTTTPHHAPLDRNLAIEMVRVTEAAAMAAGRVLGWDDKDLADQMAVDAMRAALDSVAVDGEVVIGEGEKDEAPMLYIGERVGSGAAPVVDIAVDPIEGTTLVANGMPGAVSIITLAERGTMMRSHVAYMEKSWWAPPRVARSTSRRRPAKTSGTSRMSWACARATSRW